MSTPKSASGTSASDAEICGAVSALAAEGLLVDPAAALTVAVLPKLLDSGQLDRKAICVVLLTAGGSRWQGNNGIPDFVVDETVLLSERGAAELWSAIEHRYV